MTSYKWYKIGVKSVTGKERDALNFAWGYSERVS